MANIIPAKPPFFFSYWRPWNKNSDFANSYMDYVKDVTLARYAADTVGKYINEASLNQVNAINELGERIGMGLDILSSQMHSIDSKLASLNKKLDLQIEQQKITNILLENIGELLRVPNSEKERLHCIEAGLKFFKNAQKDDDLYNDALEELLKAEQLKKQDPFVLHKIGLIYLYALNFINPQKALDYFTKAAKYAVLEFDTNGVDENQKSVSKKDDISKSYITIKSPIPGFFYRKTTSRGSFFVEIDSDVNPEMALGIVSDFDSINEVEKIAKTDPDSAYVINENKIEMGKVRICTFSQIVDTAEKRLFGLRQKLSERYDDVPGMELFKKHATQLKVDFATS